MKYAYYPGCSAHSTARESHQSTLAVAQSLGIDLIEPEGWSCCGATPAHQTDRVLAAALPAANLVLAQKMGMEMISTCAACFNRLKMANHEVNTNQEMRASVGDALGFDYDGSVKVRHFMEVLTDDVGYDTIRGALKHSLNGLRIACYYGCLMVRPHEVMQFDDPENPQSLERFVTMLGGESLEWPHKVECCGGSLSLTRTDVVVKLTDTIIGMAKASGAECIAVTCPMCQSNLDLRQADIEKQLGIRHDMPVVYMTQLLGLCLGIPPEELGFNKLMVAADKVITCIE